MNRPVLVQDGSIFQRLKSPQAFTNQGKEAAMNSWRQLQEESQSALESTGIPRRVLRLLVETPNLGVGSSILEAGCGRGKLAAFLSNLGFQVSGFDESVEDILVARDSAPKVAFRNGTSTTIPYPVHEFDLIIVRDLDVYSRSLLDREAFRTSAQLLSCLRPGGRLVFLQQLDSDVPSETVGHSNKCFAQHLAAFPGATSVTSLNDYARQFASWKSKLSLIRSVEHLLASIDSPAEHRSRNEWIQMADAVGQNHRNACCSWSTGINHQFSRRAAA